MTVTLTQPPRAAARAGSSRFHLHRAGILNVWQYDEQIFTFADGRLLLRGANGAGKSKTLEMLLPFALDGDKARITASAKHHTSLLWLMTDGVPGGNRVGYVWVEFLHTAQDGTEEAFTCGVGIRASATARTATAWHFATGRRIGHDLALEDASGPLSRPALEEALAGDGEVFQRAADYKAHVGRILFGLDPAQYDEVLRLLYWLRQPQVGEDIEPAKLAQQLSQALPQLDERTVRSAGETFDEMTAVGEQLERRAAAAHALGGLAEAYTAYAQTVVAERASALADVLSQERRLRSEVARHETRVREVETEQTAAHGQRNAARAGVAEDDARLRALEDSPEFRDQRRLAELDELARWEDQIARAADDRYARQEKALRRHEETESRRAQAAQAKVSDRAGRLQELDRRQRRSVPGSGVPPLPPWEGRDRADHDRFTSLTGSLDRTLEGLGQARSALSRRLAGVRVVRGAMDRADQASAVQRESEREAERAETRWEHARRARIGAEEELESASVALRGQLTTWTSSPAAPGHLPADLLPDPLTAETVPGLPARARAAADLELASLRQDHAVAQARWENGRTEIERLRREREEVASRRHPSPPPPVLPRTARTDGLPLWQAIDFTDGLDAPERAGLEAALQDAGLLDAWVRPGGRLLDAEERDVVIVGADSTREPAGGLLELLAPDLPDGCDLTDEDVCRVLAAIGAGPESAADHWARIDGTWRLGPAHGRAGKPTAQFIGATAREQERARRLAVIDAALEDQQHLLDESERTLASTGEAISELEAWVAEVPTGHLLLQVAARLDERLEAEDRQDAENRRAQEGAHRARTSAAEARSALEQVATAQDLPAARGALEAVEQELRDLDEALRDAERQDPAIRDDLLRWQEAVAELSVARQALEEEGRAATEARQRAGATRAAVEALRASVGASVQELQRKIAELKTSRTVHSEAEEVATKQLEELFRLHGQATANLDNARARLAEQLTERSAVLGALGQVEHVPGMIAAAGLPENLTDVIPRLAAQPDGDPVPRDVAAGASALADLTGSDSSTTATRLWRAYNDAASGPAADHQIAMAEFGSLLAVSGRDDAGEDRIVPLSRRVSATVERDRGLLTEREKQQFEQHILGELGDAIRQCRRDAEELVTAMNDQLGHVSTSQGIRVRLDWRLRADVPAEAREAVGLLGQPLGALIPEERASLRDALHRLIEASRAERPELSYSEHLAAALDYRTWSEFTIRYTRPETPGHWERLHRRSALSQGEQKVLCYLPLFAAAAAHFTSLAGAAPHAPRLVLLDDAFPKIDVRTHPLLFGLLVQLDLDFVITSERLWGDHETVPSLAIYEALRDPGQRGIAQYEYRWDGRALQALG